MGSITKYLHLLNKILKNKIDSRNARLFKVSIAMTYRCNARCRFCNIWSIYRDNGEDYSKELSKKEYDKLFSNLDLSWLHLSGGEPFLRSDFKDIVTSASEKMQNLIVIDTSTNGFLTDHIQKTVKEILENVECNFHVGVSLDGVPEIHNASRGLGNSWEKSLSTFKSLRLLSDEYSNFHAHINHFLSPANIMYFQDFIKVLGNENINTEEVSLEVGRTNDLFRNSEMHMDVEEIIRDIDFFENLGGKKWYKLILDPRVLLRLNYLKFMKRYLRTGSRIPCAALTSEVFLDPIGNIFPCSGLLKKPLINVKDTDYNLEKFLSSAEGRSLRNHYRNCKLCWSGCEGTTSLIQNIPFSLLS